MKSKRTANYWEARTWSGIKADRLRPAKRGPRKGILQDVQGKHHDGDGRFCKRPELVVDFSMMGGQ